MEIIFEIWNLVRHALALVAPTVIVSIFGVLALFATVCLLKVFISEEE